MAAALACLLALAACGSSGAESEDPASYKRRGDEAAAAGAWARAAQAYGQAFALEDPVAERAPARAWLALRRAWALKRAGRPEDALAWLRWAERLDAALYPVHFERAMLYDGHVPHLALPEAALSSYRRFLAGWRAAGEPEAEADMVAHAERRRDELESSDEASGG